MIYLLPWEKENSSFDFVTLYHRKELGTNKIYATITYDVATKEWSTAVGRNRRTIYPSFEQATKQIDERFIEYSGFYFINENDVKRFEEKLIILI